MPGGAAPLTRGLGWTLIDAFAGQLGAIVEVQVSAGTRVTFRFAATGAGRAHSRRSR
jgi:two-component sensor histidine kinase